MDAEDIARIAKDIESGSFSSSLKELEELFQRAEFEKLDKVARARAFRIRASLALASDDSPVAETYLQRAEACEPASEDNGNLRVRIELQKSGAASALAILTGTGIKAILLRASLQYLSGDLNSAISTLYAVSDGYPKEAEVFRLSAILRLAGRTRDLANVEAKRAFELAPHSLQVRYTMGVVYYHSCIPDSLTMPAIESAPEPPPREFLIINPSSLADLRGASELFASCLDSLEDNAQFRDEIELWRLASIATDPAREADAVEYATLLLDRERSNDRAVRWVLAYDIPVVLDRWVARVERAVERRESRSSSRLALACYYMERGDYTASDRVLVEGDQSESEDEKVNRLLQLSRTYAERKLFEKAREVLADVEHPEIERIRSVIANLELASKGEPTAGDSVDPLALLRICRDAAAKADWETVAQKSGKLIELLPTPAAASLALLGLYNTKQYPKFFELYERARAWGDLSWKRPFRNDPFSASRI